jgi:hypothetical protein
MMAAEQQDGNDADFFLPQHVALGLISANSVYWCIELVRPGRFVCKHPRGTRILENRHISCVLYGLVFGMLVLGRSNCHMQCL